MPTSCCPARCTRRTRAPRPAARAGSSRSTRPSNPQARRASTGRSCSTSPNASASSEYFPYTNTEEIFDELRRRLRRRYRRLQGRDVATDRRRDGPVLADPRRRAPGYPAPVRGRHVLPPRRQGTLPRRAVPRVRRGRRRRVPGLADHRPGRVSQYLSGTQTRRIASARRPVPRTAVRDAPASSPNVSASPTATSSPSRRGAAR